MASQSHISPSDGGAGDHGRAPRRRPPSKRQTEGRVAFGRKWSQLIRDVARQHRNEGR